MNELIEKLVDDCVVSDSYGVMGSDFLFCLVCQGKRGPEAETMVDDWHAKDCPVAAVRAALLAKSAPPKEVAALIERLRAWIASFPHSAPLRVDLEAAAGALARLSAPVPDIRERDLLIAIKNAASIAINESEDDEQDNTIVPLEKARAVNKAISDLGKHYLQIARESVPDKEK